MKTVAIVGAGVSGLAAAFRLAEFGADVCVFEKSRGLSGRAASRTRNGCRYDYGANYFHLNGNGAARLLFEDLPNDDICRVLGDIRGFDRDNQLLPADPNRTQPAKWSYRGGISTLGKLLVETGGIVVENSTLIRSLSRKKKNWILEDETGQRHGPFEVVILTPPAPQTAALIKTAPLGSGLKTLLLQTLGEAPYLAQFSVIQNFAEPIELPDRAYALINVDREHPIAWLSHENRKQGHVPDGETLLITQMAPHWTEENYEKEIDHVISQAHELSRMLLGPDLP
ncbi:MAG: FAD-dependent oxidoreductase, partial [Verrucomicrobiota bacterium]